MAQGRDMKTNWTNKLKSMGVSNHDFLSFSVLSPSMNYDKSLSLMACLIFFDRVYRYSRCDTRKAGPWPPQGQQK